EKPICLRGASLADHTTPLGILADLIQRGLTLPEIGPSLFSDVPPEQKESAEELAAVVHYLAGQKELDDRMQSLDPQALRLEIHLAVRFVLERSAAIAKERGCAPLFVHLEDLQWIDAASQEALEFLGANLRFDAPIFFIWTYRPEFRWSPELKTQFQAEEIELKPLPQDSCRAILRNVLGESAFPSGEEDLLVRRSGGNPFFMEELIQSLIDDGTLQRENDSWRLSKAIDEAGLPDTINRMILARIDKIRPEHKQVLMAASVVGETIPSVIIQDVGHRMGAEKAGVEIRLKNLHDLGFLYPKERKGSLGSEFAFRHALTRDVVYSTLLNHNKKILHGLAGQAYEHVYKDRPQDHSALLFHHFSRAGLKDKTITYGLMAVDQMVRQYATKEGLEVAQVLWPLLKESGNSAHHLDARIRLTEAEIKLFDLLGKRQEQLKRVESLEEMCRSRSTPELAARAALHRGSYFAGIGDFRQTKEYVRKGLDTCPADGGPSRLRMDLLRTYGIAAYSMGEYAEALKHYEQGLSISKELGERGAEAAFYNTVGLVHFNMGQPREALEYYTRAYEIMDEIGDRRGQGNALGNQGLVYWTLGEYSRALEQLNQSHKIFREIGFRKGQAVTMGNIGVIHHKLGQYTEALRCYETALALRREIHDRAGEGYDLVNIGVVHQHLGNYVKAIEHFEAGEWLAREVGSNYLLSENLNCLGIVYRKLGETDTALLSRARSKVEEALHIALEHKLVPAQVKALSNIGRILWALGEREVALAKSTEAMKLIEVHQSGVEGSEEDAYINHYFILSDAGRGSEAREWLGKLVHLIEDRAARIKEEAYRRSFLEEVRQNRYALSEWRKNPD
ncbi:MAG TPA: tetratricopeptide repeat protein, partial [Bdellovibrionota bacterium]|nr:tetratricopeptide repeat protein [Bdellovibrionota bacterium]